MGEGSRELPGSSPILYKNLLILHLEGTDRQQITALDKTTGETVWETDRPGEIYDELEPIGRKAYITPVIIRVGDRDLMIRTSKFLYRIGKDI